MSEQLFFGLSIPRTNGKKFYYNDLYCLTCSDFMVGLTNDSNLLKCLVINKTVTFIEYQPCTKDCTKDHSLSQNKAELGSTYVFKSLAWFQYLPVNFSPQNIPGHISITSNFILYLSR